MISAEDVAQKAEGLTSEEAGRRLLDLGPNEVDPGRGRSVLTIIFETLKEPMFLLLIAAAAIYAFMGDLGEGLFLLGGAGAAIGLVIFQEARSEQALKALRQLAQPQSRVLRDGAERRVPAREIVPGDIVLAGEGERLPTDGLLVAGDVLSVDESVITGESATLAKTPAQDTSPVDEDAKPGSAAGHNVFAGTLIVRGQAVIRATRTGPHSELGRIGRSLAEIEQEPTPLQQSTGRLVGYLGLVALASCGLIAAAYGLLRGDWPGGALAGITVAIALIPEEFPMVLAIFLALGAWRLATHKVLYEAFAVKMLGALRQEIIFARQLMEAGRPPQWIGVPLILTSHTWENGKNQQSHQDPTLGEALLGEMSDVARVIFAVDAATGVEALRQIYASRGVIGCIVAPKRATAEVCTDAEARKAFETGVAEIENDPGASLQIVAIGAYQLAEARRAAARLRAEGLGVNVTAILEPGRLRLPRDRFEEAFVVPDQVIRDLFPPGLARLLVTHTRPEMMTGLLRRLDEGPSLLRAHGYLSRGGTLDAPGMLFANRSTWAHLVLSAADLLGLPAETLLSPSELAATVGQGDPKVLR